MALGLAPDRTSALLMAASVGLHQPAESVALLVAFLKTSLSRNAIIRWLLFFSMVGPLGISIGLYISRLSSPFISGVVLALTAGTFLYIGATEVRITRMMFSAPQHMISKPISDTYHMSVCCV